MQIRLAKARALKFEKEESTGIQEKEEKVIEEKKVNVEKVDGEKEKQEVAENGNKQNNGNMVNDETNNDGTKKKYADESDWLEDDDEEEYVHVQKINKEVKEEKKEIKTFYGSNNVC